MNRANPPLILASGSAYKRELLRRLSLRFRAVDADIDERARPDETPAQTASRLALSKALRVQRDEPEAWIIGADQVVHLDGHRCHKPRDAARAFAQLRRLAGHTHELLTAVTVLSPAGRSDSALVRYQMQMRQLTDVQIRAYLAEDEPYECAGSYKIESAGIKLFRRIAGDDYTAIVGLPLTRVWHLLETTGFFGDPITS